MVISRAKNSRYKRIFPLFEVRLYSCKSGAKQWCQTKASLELLLAHCQPGLTVEAQRIEEWGKTEIGEQVRLAIVRAYALALLATKNPAVEVALFAFALTLDCSTRDTARGVDMSLFYSTIRTRLDASATLSTTLRNKRFVVLVTLLRNYNLAQEYKRTEVRSDEQ